MFSKKLMNFYKNNLTNFQQSIRYKTNTQKIVKRKREVDPGIRYRQKVLQDPSDNNTEEIDFEELETDFMQLDMTHKEHTQQMELMHEREKYLIVERKYFKQKLPNFLTYSDKQQIRYLHNADPELWTVEKLSEGFPALPDVIKKIVKGNWLKKNENKIKQHDNSVQSNWSLFKKGKLDNMPPDLNEHLKKFTNRALNLNSIDLPESVAEKPKQLITGEFSEIITSYENLKNKPKVKKSKEETNFETEIKKKSLKETHLLIHPSEFKNNENVTWNEWNKSQNSAICEKLPGNENIPVEIDKSFNDDSKSSSHIQKYKSKTSDVVKTSKDYGHLMYPERIKIPTDKLKKGSLYKLNDCYYDDDGEFLYRVPGMY